MAKTEETEPETTEESVPAGAPGQLLFPDEDVDAERAAAFAGGKEETLYPEGDPRNEGWTNPADRSAEVTDESDQEDAGE